MKKRMISLVMAICMLCGLALNGIALPASAATQTLANIEETIAIENDVPKDWINYNANSDDSTCRPAYTIEDDVAGGNGKVLTLSRETASGGTNGKIYQFDETQKVTLEYRVKSDVTSSASSCFFLPSFVYNDASDTSAATTPMWLFARSTGCLYKEDMTFSDGGSQWALKKASYSADGWNSVKCELDLASSTPSIKLWMNGTEVSLISDAYNLQSDLQITGFMIGSSVGAKGTVYLDDLTVTYEAETTEDPEITFYGDNLELGNTLNMAFTFKNDQRNDWTGYTAKVTMNGETTTYAQGEWKTDGSGNYYYIYFTGINARNMSDEITVGIYDAENVLVSEIYTTSIETYCEEMLADNPDNTKLKNVVDALLAYGAAAKTYFE